MRIKLIKTILFVIVTFLCMAIAIGAKYYVKSVQSFKINLTTKLSGVKELTVKSIIERDNELVIELYNDESYFCREFKKTFGITPSEYAKASRK